MTSSHCFRRHLLVVLVSIVTALSSAQPIETKVSHPQTGFPSRDMGAGVWLQGDLLAVGAPDTGQLSGESLIGTVYLYRNIGGTWQKEAEVAPPVNYASGSFGQSVAISGDMLLVGYPGDDSIANRAGSVCVYRNIGGTWTYQSKLPAVGLTQLIEFGHSIDFDGDVAVVGGSGSDTIGAAQVFTRSGDTWTHTATLIPPVDVNDDFYGSTIAIDGDRIVVGSHDTRTGSNPAGVVFVFEKVGAAWEYSATITPSQPTFTLDFGYSVDVQGDRIIVGTTRDAQFGANSGAAFIYQLEANTWMLNDKITRPGAGSQQYFGHKVSFDGDFVYISAPSVINQVAGFGDVFKMIDDPVDGWVEVARFEAADSLQFAANFGANFTIDGDNIAIGCYDTATGDPGRVHCYRETSTNSYDEQVLYEGDAAGFDHFGEVIAMDGTTAVVGMPESNNAFSGEAGAGYICELAEDGQSVLSMQAIAGDNLIQSFGQSVAIDDDTAIIGAPLRQMGNGYPGAAYVYVRGETEWKRQTMLLYATPADGDRFGASVDVSGDTIVIGVPREDSHLTDTGIVQVLTRSGNAWDHVQYITNPAATSNLRFGRSVALSGDMLVVGCDSGLEVYVFQRTSTVFDYQATITAPAGLIPSFGFGRVLAFDGDAIVIGAPTADFGTIDSGAAYYSVRTGTTWSQPVRLDPGPFPTETEFGTSIGLSGNRCVIGSLGGEVAWIYRRTGDNFILDQTLVGTGAVAGDAYGKAVAIDGDTLLIGAPDANDPEVESGSIYMYRFLPPEAESTGIVFY